VRGLRARTGRLHAVLTAAGAGLLLGLTLPADVTAPPAPSPGARPAGYATLTPGAHGPAGPGSPDARPAVRQTRIQHATAVYACIGRHSRVKLRAARDADGRVEITMAAARLTSPVALSAGDVRVTLRLTARHRGERRTIAFSGTNPGIREGGPLRAGPLWAKVAEGTRLDSFRGRNAVALELHRGLVGVRCSAKTAQRPGPFRF
jgi:hypothetical protein